MPVVASRFLRRSGSEESIQWENRPSCASAPSLSSHPMPFRITQESYRPRVSDRTMVGALPTDLLASFRSRIASTSSCHETPTMGTIRSGLAAKKRSRRSALRSAQATRAGARCARNSTASSRGRRVPLDIPFYRTFRPPLLFGIRGHRSPVYRLHLSHRRQALPWTGVPWTPFIGSGSILRLLHMLLESPRRETRDWIHIFPSTSPIE